MLLQYLTISEFLAKNLFDNGNFQFVKPVPRGIGFFMRKKHQPKRIRISAVFHVPYVHGPKIDTYGTHEMG